MSGPMVLIVEDLDLLAESWSRRLREMGVTVLWADNVPKAEELFRSNGRFAAIIMDCCVPGRTPNTMDLVRRIREGGFDGPIIASSSNPEFLKPLVLAGADCACEKRDLLKKLFEILGL